jgi:type IV pilus assembly protein PilN
MIRINLLPFRAARKKENVRRQISILLLSLALIFVASLLLSNVLSNKIKSLNLEIANTKQEIEKYAKINEEIKLIKQRIEVLNKKTEVIRSLERSRLEPVKLLEYMTQLIVPNRMWFTSFTFKDNNVGINGMAIDNNTIADFMTKLENSKQFSAVNLKTIEKKQFQNIDMKSFQLNCVKIQ